MLSIQSSPVSHVFMAPAPELSMKTRKTPKDPKQEMEEISWEAIQTEIHTISLL